MAKGRRTAWQVKHIENRKLSIKSELDQIQEGEGNRARFDAIMDGIRKYESSVEPEDLLTLYIYVISALVHHKNHGGLQTAQVKKLTSLAYSLLQMQDIQPETSQLGYLYGEIHMALSQIYRKSGMHLAAAWEQQVSHHVAKKSPPGGLHFQALAQAIRAMRLGQIQRALFEYMVADADEVPERQREMARLGRIRCLRFLGKSDLASELINTFLESSELTERFILELEWEKICIHTTRNQDLELMMNAVQRKGSHYSAVYLLEAHLWALADKQRKWQDRLPKVATIQRNKNLSSRGLGFFNKVMLQLEECQDSSIPLIVRIKALGSLIHDLDQFIAIDRQLLFYVAAARWLAKIHSPTLASVMLGEYEGLCRKISQGQSGDIFQMAQDLYERSWYQECQVYDSKVPKRSAS